MVLNYDVSFSCYPRIINICFQIISCFQDNFLICPLSHRIFLVKQTLSKSTCIMWQFFNASTFFGYGFWRLGGENQVDWHPIGIGTYNCQIRFEPCTQSFWQNNTKITWRIFYLLSLTHPMKTVASCLPNTMMPDIWN